MPKIQKSYSGEAPTLLTLTSLLDPTNAPPAGVTIPSAFTFANGAWSFSFAGVASLYAYAYTITWSDATTTPGSGTIVGDGQAVGIYTTQALIEGIGKLDADIWSNINGTDQLPDATRFQTAINSTDALFNRLFRIDGYSTPIASTSGDFAFIQDLATKYALTELYMVPRGLRDKTDKIGGQLAELRQWVLDQLDGLIIGGIDGTQLVSSHGITVVPTIRPVDFCNPCL